MEEFTYQNNYLIGDKHRLLKAYSRLKYEYQMIDLLDTSTINPIKHSYVLSRNADCVVRSTNVMSAQTKKGVFTKVITIDDEKRITNEDIIYTKNDDDMHIYRVRNLNITPLRCAMMACLACELNYEIDSETVIGFIGNGNINITTAKLLNLFFGVNHFVIRGSSKDRGKNISHFINAINKTNISIKVDYSDDFEEINKCEIVICCTSSCNKKDLISVDKLNKPRLFIAQDSGYIFDESFRNSMICYTDLKEQIMNHYKDEFPYDRHIHNLITMREDYSDRQRSVYLYGIALADAIVYEEVVLC